MGVDTWRNNTDAPAWLSFLATIGCAPCDIG